MRWNDAGPRCKRWMLPVLVTGLLVGCQDTAGRLTAPHSGPRLNVGAADAETLFRGIIFGQNYISDQIPEIRDNLKVDLLANAQFTSAQILDFQERLLTNVKQTDPGFLSRFKSAVNSGDHVRIGAVLDTAGALVNDAMQPTSEGSVMAYYDSNPAEVESQMQPHLDPNGYFSLGDTLVTPADASNEISISNNSEYGGGEWGGCEDPTQIICDSGSGVIRIHRHGVIVYYVGGVHVALVYNAYAFVVAGRYIAVFSPKRYSAPTSLLRDQIIDSIATRMRV